MYKLIILEEMHNTICRILFDYDEWNDAQKISAIESIVDFGESVLKMKIGEENE